MRKLILSISVLSLLQISVFAQDNNPGDISPDRPDQTESPDIIPPGFTQIEGGFTYESYNENYGNYLTFSYNSYSFAGLIRVGIFPSMEIRVAPEYLSSKNTAGFFNPYFNYDIEASGFLPLVIGTKIKITDETKDIPGMAFLFQADLPSTAGDDFETDETTPEFRIAASKQISDRFSLGFNIGAQFYSRETIGIYTLSLGADLTEKMGGFIELYGFFGNGTINYADGGVTYRIMKNLQFDLSGGLGLSEGTPDFFIGGGLSVRLPR